MNTTTKSAFEDAVRSLTPMSIPDDQREGILALLQLFKTTPKEALTPLVYQLLSPSGESSELPESVFLLFERMIEVLAQGDAIAIVPVHKELTTQQAANLLNISRQYLVRLLEAGELPYYKVGAHRRLKMEDVVFYKQKRDRERSTALDELAQLSQDFGGYNELRADDDEC